MNLCGADNDLGDLLELYSESDLKFNALEDEIESSSSCGICSENLRTPRILTCLHEFCEACLEDSVEGNINPDLVIGIDETPKVKNNSGKLSCPKCQQITKLGPNGIQGLTLDLILIGPSEAPPTDANGTSILCASCKAKEPAVGRCEDCSNFLCNNCFTAHKYMRVLENHRIVTLEELQASGQVSPPPKYFPCPRHPEKPVDRFCLPCQEACCIKCLNRAHFGPEHICDSAHAVSNRYRTEIPLLGREAKSRLDDCRKSSRQLEASFSDLEKEREEAKKMVDDAFQSFRATLENIKESVFVRIDEKHKAKELRVMEDLNKLQTQMNKIEIAEAFTGRMVDFGAEDASSLVAMWAVLRNQLYDLAGPLESIDMASDPIKFEFDTSTFERAVKNCVGHFIDEEPGSPPSTPGTLPNRILQSEEQTHRLPQGLLTSDELRNSPIHPGPIQRPTQSLSLSPELAPVSSPLTPITGQVGSSPGVGPPPMNDMQALTSAMASAELTNGYATHRTPTPDMTNQLGLRSIHQAYSTGSIQEFNLAAQLVNYAEKEQQRPSSHGRPVTSPNLGPPSGAMTLADLIAGVESNNPSHAMSNLQALVQMGHAQQANGPPQSNPILGMRNGPALGSGSRMGMTGAPGPTGPGGMGSYPNLLNGGNPYRSNYYSNNYTSHFY